MHCKNKSRSDLNLLKGLLLILLLLLCHGNVYAGLDLTVENNTGATIEVSNYCSDCGCNKSAGCPSVLIAPVSIIKLRNFLSRGRNEIRVTAPCTTTKQDVVQAIWVSGDTLKKNKIEVTENDFGAYLMADRSGCSDSMAKRTDVPSKRFDPTGEKWITEHNHNQCDATVGNKSICKKYSVDVTFEYHNGELVGKPSVGDKVHGQLNGFRYDYKYGWGWGTLVFSSDFKQFSGYFRDKYGHGGDWSGYRP